MGTVDRSTCHSLGFKNRRGGCLVSFGRPRLGDRIWKIDRPPTATLSEVCLVPPFSHPDLVVSFNRRNLARTRPQSRQASEHVRRGDALQPVASNDHRFYRSYFSVGGRLVIVLEVLLNPVKHQLSRATRALSSCWPVD